MRRLIRPAIGVIIICLAGAAVGLGSNALRPDGLSLVRKKVVRPIYHPPTAPKDGNPVVPGPMIGTQTAAQATNTSEQKPNTTPPGNKNPGSKSPAGPKVDGKKPGTQGPEPPGVKPPGGNKKVQALFTKLEDAKTCFDNKSAIFIDARPKEDYEAKHVAGALSIPLDDLDALYSKVLAGVPKDKLIITYCSDAECGSATKLADNLVAKGHTNVLILLEGLPAWEGAGYLTAAGKEPGR